MGQAPAASPPAARSTAPRPAATAPRDEAAEASSRRSGAELEAILSRLRTDNLAVRRAAVRQILELEREDIPLIRARLLSPLGPSYFNVHARMVRAIVASTNGRENAEYDLLNVLVAATPRSPELDVAIERIALARALGGMQSADAGRALLPFAMEHGRIFRQECLRIVRISMREYILPALIEARVSGDDLRNFIRMSREMLRRNTPGDSVQTRDNALLAEIIRAYASLRQPEAIRVTVSFVNSDRAQVREAARWAVSQYGQMGINALREAYENFAGQDANPQWNWERISRELYAANDRRRTEEVTHAMDDGLAAARGGRYADMMGRFEFVLARHPLFERRAEMVAPMVRHARTLESSDAGRAESVYRLALRVDPTGPQSRAIESMLQFLGAERALAQGVADPELYRVALRSDPNNARARAQLESVGQEEFLRSRRRGRTIAAFGLLTLSLAGLWFMLQRLRGHRSARTPVTPAGAASRSA